MAIGSGLSAQLGIAQETQTSAQVTIAITGSPTGGTFTVTINGATTAAIAYNATAATVASAIQVLDTVQSATTLTSSGGPLPGSSVIVTMGGILANNASVTVAAAGSFTGGSSPAVTATVTTAGSGYGTYQVPTRFLEIKNESMKLQMTPTPSAALRANNRVLRNDRWLPNKKGAGGNIDFEVTNTGMALLFQMMFGNGGTNYTPTTPTNGVLTRLWTFYPQDLFAQSYTIQAGRPTNTGVVQPFSYVGSKVADWTLSNTIDQLLDLQVTIDAQDEVLTQSLAAASYPTAQQLFSFTGAQITMDGGNFDAKSISIKQTNGIKSDRYLLRGDSRKREPILNQMMAITGSLDLEFSSTYMQSKFNSLVASGNNANITATWTGSLIESVASPGPYYYQIVVQIPYARVDGDSPNIAGPEILTQTVPFTATWNGSTQPISLLYYTTDTSL